MDDLRSQVSLVDLLRVAREFSVIDTYTLSGDGTCVTLTVDGISAEFSTHRTMHFLFGALGVLPEACARLGMPSQLRPF